MYKSNGFDPDVFKDLTEGHLRDRKEMLPAILSTDKGRKDFLEDVLAFANSARTHGQDTFILFGVTNFEVQSKRYYAVGIEGQDLKSSPRFAQGTTWAEIEHQQGELIGRVLLTQIAQHIGNFHVRYEYGYVDGVDKEDRKILKRVLVSYLILPGRTPREWHDQPYQIRLAVKGPETKNVILNVGTCFIRLGESNYPVTEVEKQNLYCHTVMPFICREEWRRFAVGQEREARADTEFQTLPLYGEIVNREVGSEQPILNLLQQCTTNNEQRILVCNAPGSGKTTALRRIAVKLAQEMDQALTSQSGSNREWFNTPEAIVPIYYSLSDYCYGFHGTLLHNIYRRIQATGVFQEISEEQFQKLLQHRLRRYVIFLDAFDEISTHEQQQTITQIRGFINEFRSQAFIVIGCRSNRVNSVPDYHQFLRIDILPLHQKDVYMLIEQECYQSGSVLLDFVDRLEAPNGYNRDFYRLLVRPRMLDAMRAYIAEIAGQPEIIEFDEDDEQDITDQTEVFEFGGESGGEIDGETVIIDSAIGSEGSSDYQVVGHISRVLDSIIEYYLRSEWTKHRYGHSNNIDIAIDHIRETLEAVALSEVRQNNSLRAVRNQFGHELFDWCHRADILYRYGKNVRFVSPLVRDYFIAAAVTAQNLDEQQLPALRRYRRALDFVHEFQKPLVDTA